MASDGRPKSLRDFSKSGLLSKSPLERVQMFFDIMARSKTNHFDSWLLRQVKVVEASEGRCVFEIEITKEMCNATGNLHGGCAATLLDDLTSTPSYTLAKPGFLDAGTVSRTLTCTYLRPVLPGQTVKVVAEAVTLGKTMCHFRGDLITADGKVAVTCIHDKVARPPSKL